MAAISFLKRNGAIMIGVIQLGLGANMARGFVADWFSSSPAAQAYILGMACFAMGTGTFFIVKGIQTKKRAAAMRKPLADNVKEELK